MVRKLWRVLCLKLGKLRKNFYANISAEPLVSFEWIIVEKCDCILLKHNFLMIPESTRTSIYLERFKSYSKKGKSNCEFYGNYPTQKCPRAGTYLLKELSLRNAIAIPWSTISLWFQEVQELDSILSGSKVTAIKVNQIVNFTKIIYRNASQLQTNSWVGSSIPHANSRMRMYAELRIRELN